MFNSLNHKTNNDIYIEELSIFGVNQDKSGFIIELGDQTLKANNLEECNNLINEGINELKTHLFELWQYLSRILNDIINGNSSPDTDVENLIFLNCVKKCYSLSRLFDELEDISKLLLKVQELDISIVSSNHIHIFVSTYMQIRCLHLLILSEIYRQHLIQKIQTLSKTAQISGPWANVDLPMKERIWKWDAAEDQYFKNRQDDKRSQIRYNPEYNPMGYYMVWQDPNQHPYRFTDRKNDSPYPSNLQVSIP